jgi:hypothetical protein
VLPAPSACGSSNKHHQVIKRRDALSGQNGFPLDLIDAVFRSATCFGMSFSTSGLPGPSISNLFYLKSFELCELQRVLVNYARQMNVCGRGRMCTHPITHNHHAWQRCRRLPLESCQETAVGRTALPREAIYDLFPRLGERSRALLVTCRAASSRCSRSGER